MSKLHSASCSCGKVSFTIPLSGQAVGICHCATCQKISSSFFAAVAYNGDIEFAGAEHIKIYSSSDWAERAFCITCGSILFYKLKSSSEYHISAALFDDKTNFDLKTQIFTDVKPKYLELAAKTKNMTRQECFDKWG